MSKAESRLCIDSVGGLGTARWSCFTTPALPYEGPSVNRVEGRREPTTQRGDVYQQGCVRLRPFPYSQELLAAVTSSKTSRHNFRAERTAIRSVISFFQSIFYSPGEERAVRLEEWRRRRRRGKDRRSKRKRSDSKMR